MFGKKNLHFNLEYSGLLKKKKVGYCVLNTLHKFGHPNEGAHAVFFSAATHS